jgi:hypothetical protein
MEGVEHGARDEGGLVCDPEMADGVEGVGEDNSLYWMSGTIHVLISRKRSSGLLCYPFAPGRQDRTSLPIPVLLLHGSCRAHTSFQTEVDQALLGVL